MKEEDKEMMKNEDTNIYMKHIYINISYGSGSVETLSTIYHPIFEKNPCNTNSNIYISRERERERERESIVLVLILVLTGTAFVARVWC